MIISGIRKKLMRAAVVLAVVSIFWAKTSAQEKSDVYLPSDSIVVFALDLAAIQSNKNLEIMPWEIVTAAGMDYMGVDPLLATQIWGGVSLPGIAGPEFGVQIKTSRPVNIDDLKPELFGPIKTSAKAPDIKLRPMIDTPLSVVRTKNSILFGTEGTLRKLMGARATPSKFIEMLAADKEPIRIVLSLEPLRELIRGLIEQYEFMITEDIAGDLAEMNELTEYVYIQGDLGNDLAIRIHFGAKDVASAKRMQEVILSLRSQGMDQMIDQIQKEIAYMPMSDEMRTAWAQYLGRARSILEATTDPVLAGNRSTIEVKNIQAYFSASMLFAIAAPVMDSFRAISESASPANHLKELGLAFHNHADAYRQFPPRAISDEDGKPLLSWRVKLLPFVDGGVELYEQFHLDEPWDSEHNKELLAKIPEVYKNKRVDVPEGYTTYVAPYGAVDDKRTIWDIEKCGFRNVTDGTSNTIMFVEVNADAAVPWTKPDDFDLSAKSLLEFLLKKPKGGYFGFCDGSVITISDELTEEELEAMLSCGGGEVIEFR